jgi:hypothetical protein
VLALLQVGGHPVKIDAALAAQIRALDGDYRFETYMSLHCQSCPDTVQALNAMSVLNPRIRHVAIDGSLFQAEVEARQILSVPTVYLNGAEFDAGRMSIEQILARLDTGAAARAAKRSEPRPTTCWWSAAVRPARRRRSTPRARASAPASSPSASAARCWTRWRSRTSPRSNTPKARSLPRRWKRTCAATAWT